MSNQTFLWASFIIPWLTLFFMKREDIKRFIPVALFTALLSLIIGEIAGSLRFWEAGETVFPFKATHPTVIGALPVVTMWIFKFTYGRFWVYLVTNAILDLGFAFVFFPWLVLRGMMAFLSSSLIVYLLNWVTQIVIYGYQIWQEGIFLGADKTSSSHNFQPAMAKLLDEDCEDKK